MHRQPVTVTFSSAGASKRLATAIGKLPCPRSPQAAGGASRWWPPPSVVRKVLPQLSVRSMIAGQIDAGFADQPTAELDVKPRRRQQLGRVAQGVVERGRDAIDVERLVARPAGDVEPAAEVELGQGQADRLGDLAGAGPRSPCGLRSSASASRHWAAGEHVQSAPVDARPRSGRGRALALDPRRHRTGLAGRPS